MHRTDTTTTIRPRHLSLLSARPLLCQRRMDWTLGFTRPTPSHPAWDIAQDKTTAVQAHPSPAPIRTDAHIPVLPGHSLRYCRPSRPDLRTDGLDAVGNGRLLLTIETPGRISVGGPAPILPRYRSDKELSDMLARSIHLSQGKRTPRSIFVQQTQYRYSVHRYRSTNPLGGTCDR